MVDTYDETTLAFALALPAHDLHDPVAGAITWTNVAIPPLPPGQGISFTVYFTAEHPKSVVVNRVRAQDIVDSRGAVSVSAETSRTQESIGGAAPVFKSLHPTDSVAATGLPITFTQAITNDGAAIMIVLPLTDTYDPTFLAFNYAVPTPTFAITGTLVWTDLTTYFGDLEPFQTVVVTTVFTATTQVVSTSVNQASTEGAIDVFGNDLTAGSAEVPITIIDGGPTATPTQVPTPLATATTVPTPVPTSTPTRRPRPTSTPGPGQPTAAPATDTPAPAPTVTTEATSVVLLPQSGQGAEGGWLVLVYALIALGAGYWVLGRVRRQGKNRSGDID
jgi:hypothetical protein